jgi:GNAT superfamily N-acetyltransferase
MAEFRIVDVPHAPEALRQIVRDHLHAHNIAATALTDYASVTFLLKDSREEVRGGLLGAMWGRCLHIQILWVAESLRGRGHGRRLLEAAETLAIERGCLHAFLESFSFQAPLFYQNLGYEVFGEADDWPEGHTHYFLRKRLESKS